MGPARSLGGAARIIPGRSCDGELPHDGPQEKSSRFPRRGLLPALAPKQADRHRGDHSTLAPTADASAERDRASDLGGCPIALTDRCSRPISLRALRAQPTPGQPHCAEAHRAVVRDPVATSGPEPSRSRRRSLQSDHGDREHRMAPLVGERGDTSGLGAGKPGESPRRPADCPRVGRRWGGDRHGV
jgi:hypothetical protein